ncbi:MAG: hypothetical protein ABIR08_07490 [Sphingomonas sp.]
MKIAPSIAAIAIGVAAPTGPACAQSDGPPRMIKGAESDRVLAATAMCVVNGAKEKAARILDIEPSGPATEKAIIGLLQESSFCAPWATVMRTPVVTWRGAIAEALYLKSFGFAPPPEPLTASMAPAWLTSRDYARYAVAQCAALRAPALADRLTRAKRRSPQEVASVNDLLPVLRVCGKGQKVDFDRVTIHGMIAEGLFRARGGAAIVGGKL